MPRSFPEPNGPHVQHSPQSEQEALPRSLPRSCPTGVGCSSEPHILQGDHPDAFPDRTERRRTHWWGADGQERRRNISPASTRTDGSLIEVIAEVGPALLRPDVSSEIVHRDPARIVAARAVDPVTRTVLHRGRRWTVQARRRPRLRRPHRLRRSPSPRQHRPPPSSVSPSTPQGIFRDGCTHCAAS